MDNDYKFKDPEDSFCPQDWHRLQTCDAVAGTLWVGTTEPSVVQCVWQSAEDFRNYVNLLIDVFGHIPYRELKRIKDDTLDKAD